MSQQKMGPPSQLGPRLHSAPTHVETASSLQGAQRLAGDGAVLVLAWLSCIIFSWSASSVTQPLYLSCTVMTATPTNLWMLSNSGWVRHA